MGCGDGELLAGPGRCEQVGVAGDVAGVDIADISLAVGHVGEVAGEGGAASVVNLDLHDGADACAVHSEVESADAGERGDGFKWHEHERGCPSVVASPVRSPGVVTPVSYITAPASRVHPLTCLGIRKGPAAGVTAGPFQVQGVRRLVRDQGCPAEIQGRQRPRGAWPGRLRTCRCRCCTASTGRRATLPSCGRGQTLVGAAFLHGSTSLPRRRSSTPSLPSLDGLPRARRAAHGEQAPSIPGTGIGTLMRRGDGIQFCRSTSPRNPHSGSVGSYGCGVWTPSWGGTLAE